MQEREPDDLTAWVDGVIELCLGSGDDSHRRRLVDKMLGQAASAAEQAEVTRESGLLHQQLKDWWNATPVTHTGKAAKVAAELCGAPGAYQKAKKLGTPPMIIALLLLLAVALSAAFVLSRSRRVPRLDDGAPEGERIAPEPVPVVFLAMFWDASLARRLRAAVDRPLAALDAKALRSGASHWRVGDEAELVRLRATLSGAPEPSDEHGWLYVALRARVPDQRLARSASEYQRGEAIEALCERGATVAFVSNRVPNRFPIDIDLWSFQ